MPTDTTWDADELTVALPNIFTMVDTTLTDTVFIRSDSMKVAKDLKVGLTFVGDNTSMLVDPTADSLVACAGYKYKSRWTATHETRPNHDSTYHRQYPRNDTSYIWWNDSTANCLTTFRRDSLYVVGGKLTILGKGKLKPITDEYDSLLRIDNSFNITTDSISTINHDSIKTKVILINQDPTNNSFKTKLGTDQARAIAWQEYAGSADLTHCHDGSGSGARYNPHWNHYWDNYIRLNGDTCLETKTPCENAGGSDTGIMQIYRTVWETTFDSSYHDWGYPQTFRVCKWDSLAWNWKICIENGKWIFEQAMPAKMTPDQDLFPDSCSYANCDSVPDIANKEDLANYGYHASEQDMWRIKSQENWNTYINNPITPRDREQANYIKWVRRYKYRGNLW
jgi:hypothetical protein